MIASRSCAFHAATHASANALASSSVMPPALPVLASCASSVDLSLSRARTPSLPAVTKPLLKRSQIVGARHGAPHRLALGPQLRNQRRLKPDLCFPDRRYSLSNL